MIWKLSDVHFLIAVFACYYLGIYDFERAVLHVTLNNRHGEHFVAHRALCLLLLTVERYVLLILRQGHDFVTRVAYRYVSVWITFLLRFILITICF